MEVLAPGQLPVLDHGGFAKMPFGCRMVWPWLKPRLQDSEWDGDTGEVGRTAQGLWVPAAEMDCKKFRGLSLYSPAPNWPLTAFTALSCQVDKLNDLSMRWVQRGEKHLTPVPYTST